MEKEALQTGRALAVTECSACHRFFYPREYLSEQWDGIINSHAGRTSLDKAEITDLKHYFYVASKSRS